KADPKSVDPAIKDMFERHGAPTWLFQTDRSQPASEGTSVSDVKKITSAMKLVEDIRRFGHLEADIYPVTLKDRTSDLTDAATYGLSEEDLQSIPASWLWEEAPVSIENGYDVIHYLK